MHFEVQFTVLLKIGTHILTFNPSAFFSVGLVPTPYLQIFRRFSEY
jgi:hypothetical protein